MPRRALLPSLAAALVAGPAAPTAGGPGGYLEAGDRVRARIDGLGTQIVRIGAAGAPPAPDPCAQEVSP
jgi:hypothetical protein